MTKKIIDGNITFHADTKMYTAPKVIDSFMDDNGDKVLVLENGNTTLETRYNSLWHPCRGIVKPENYKGENPDRRNLSNLFTK